MNLLLRLFPVLVVLLSSPFLSSGNNILKKGESIEFTKTDGREKLMKLTPKGTEYAERALTVIHSAENYAIKRTLERYSAAFVDAMEAFTAFFMEFDDGYDG